MDCFLDSLDLYSDYIIIDHLFEHDTYNLMYPRTWYLLRKPQYLPPRSSIFYAPSQNMKNTLIYIDDPQWTSGVAIEGELSAG